MFFYPPNSSSEIAQEISFRQAHGSFPYEKPPLVAISYSWWIPARWTFYNSAERPRFMTQITKDLVFPSFQNRLSLSHEKNGIHTQATFPWALHGERQTHSWCGQILQNVCRSLLISPLLRERNHRIGDTLFQTLAQTRWRNRASACEFLAQEWYASKSKGLSRSSV